MKESAPKKNHSFQCYTTFAEVEARWRALESHSDGSLFQSYDWQKTYHECIGRPAGDQLQIIVVQDEHQQAIMLLPFVITTKHKLRMLMFNGGLITDYCMPLTHSNFDSKITDISDFWVSIKKTINPCDAIYLVNQPSTFGPKSNHLSSLFYRTIVSSHALEIDGEWEDVHTKIVPKKIRADTRRQRKRIAELGDLSFYVAETDDQKKHIIDTMIEQKRRRYQQMGVYDMFSNSDYSDFFKTLHETWSSPGEVHVSAMTIDGVIVATHWGLVGGGRFYYLMPSYAVGAWDRFSVGRILLEELVKWSADNKLTMFDFSLGDEPYKKAWCNQSTALYESVDYMSVAGYVFYIYKKITHTIKKYKGRLNANT